MEPICHSKGGMLTPVTNPSKEDVHSENELEALTKADPAQLNPIAKL